MSTLDDLWLRPGRKKLQVPVHNILGARAEEESVNRVAQRFGISWSSVYRLRDFETEAPEDLRKDGAK